MAQKQTVKGSFFLIIILLILIAASALVIFLLRTDTIKEHLNTDSLLNVLFVLEQDGKPLSTHVLLYYPELKRSALIDIPGNTALILKSLGRMDKIEAVYSEKNIESYTKEIQSLLGIQIPFTVSMNIEQFSVMTDLLGGLKVFIPFPIEVFSADKQFLLPSGSVLLDGDKIKTYLTYPAQEESQSDIQERKQNAILAFFQSLSLNLPLILNKKAFAYFEKNIQTNVKPADLQKLFVYISGVDSERLIPQTITGTLRDVEGVALLFPFYDGQLIKDVVKQSINTMISADGEGQARIFILSIQNGTAIPGLARNTTMLYRGFGYDVLNTANAPRNDYTQTVVVDHIGNATAAKQIADIIRCKKIITDEIKPESENITVSSVDFTLILGKDFDGRYVR